MRERWRSVASLVKICWAEMQTETVKLCLLGGEGEAGCEASPGWSSVSWLSSVEDTEYGCLQGIWMVGVSELTRSDSNGFLCGADILL